MFGNDYDPEAEFSKIVTNAGLKIKPYVDPIDAVRRELDVLNAIAESISGEWDGDNSGTTEERANAADELRDKIQDIKDLIAELEL